MCVHLFHYEALNFTVIYHTYDCIYSRNGIVYVARHLHAPFPDNLDQIFQRGTNLSANFGSG